MDDKYQTQRILEFQVKDKRFLVNTRAANVAFELLSSKETLTLMGNPGDGKSVIAVFRNEGATILNPALIERIYDDNKHSIFSGQRLQNTNSKTFGNKDAS